MLDQGPYPLHWPPTTHIHPSPTQLLPFLPHRIVPPSVCSQTRLSPTNLLKILHLTCTPTTTIPQNPATTPNHLRLIPRRLPRNLHISNRIPNLFHLTPHQPHLPQWHLRLDQCRYSKRPLSPPIPTLFTPLLFQPYNRIPGSPSRTYNRPNPTRLKNAVIRKPVRVFRRLCIPCSVLPHPRALNT